MDLTDLEIESKYFGYPDLFSFVRKIGQVGKFKRTTTKLVNLDDIYFDTYPLQLTPNRGVYRLRQNPDGKESTFKEPIPHCIDGSIHRYREIEDTVTEKDAQAFLNHTHDNRSSRALRDFMEGHNLKGELHELFRIINPREVILFSQGQTTIELALDSPSYHRGETKPRIAFFIEAELKKGGDYALFQQFDNSLRETFNLRPCSLNKIEYGAMQLFSIPPYGMGR